MLYYYIRWALILYIIVLATILTYSVFPELYLPEILNTEGTFIILSAIIAPAYFILPGLIYGDEYKPRYLTWSVSEHKYYFFIFITLGLGPAIIFFRKYDPLLRRKFKWT